jgi:hypothetical protein
MPIIAGIVPLSALLMSIGLAGSMVGLIVVYVRISASTSVFRCGCSRFSFTGFAPSVRICNDCVLGETFRGAILPPVVLALGVNAIANETL